MACCNNIGTFDPCEPINTGYVATQTGNYKYVISWNGIRIKGTLDLQLNDPIILNCNLNENGYYQLDIVQPDGEKLECIEFRTKYTLNCQTQST
jgi:hypothetical protein